MGIGEKLGFGNMAKTWRGRGLRDTDMQCTGLLSETILSAFLITGGNVSQEAELLTCQKVEGCSSLFKKTQL